MSTPDRLYYAMRAEAERLLAKRATSPKAQAIHAQLAAEYEAIAKGEETFPIDRQRCSMNVPDDGAQSLIATWNASIFLSDTATE